MKFLVKENGKSIVKNISKSDSRFENLHPGQTEKYLDPSTNKFRRRGYFQSGNVEIFLCTDEAVDSTRIWKTKAEVLLSFVDIFKNMSESYLKDFTTKIDRLTHNLKKYNAHCIQASENILDPYASTSGTKGQIDTIKNNLTRNVDKSSTSIFKIIKNNKLIQAELSVYDRLYKRSNEKIIKQYHSIHKLLRATLSAFWDAFLENHVEIDLDNTTAEVYVDYETITVVLVHIVENCTKYVCPHTTLKIFFEKVNRDLKITFKMLSLKIHEEEYVHIFQEGYSGEESRQLGLNGSGIGMYIVKEFIELNNGELNLVINNNKSRNLMYSGVQYEENLIEILLPTQNWA